MGQAGKGVASYHLEQMPCQKKGFSLFRGLEIQPSGAPLPGW
jgi:hypothetical protein